MSWLKSTNRKQTQRARIGVESLEGRDLMAASIAFFADAGNDRVEGNQGVDIVLAGAGNDSRQFDPLDLILTLPLLLATGYNFPVVPPPPAALDADGNFLDKDGNPL